MTERAAQVLVSAGVLALGFAFALGTYLLPDAPGYARVGPNLFPGLISAGLLLAGALLLKEALGAGFRKVPDERRAPFNGHAFAWVSGGILVHMALVTGIGFVLASALLFAAAARGFGSARPARDFGMGVALGAAVYWVFTRALTLSLPWGAWIPG